ncbi:DUF4054 domain-containing protein [Pseudomonas brenneri]|uniref:DUF4054 domain-containing protein n=1 Tax=Pseudomonas brenneri TaxID=129817 RepID=UPI0025A1D98E|nr:DUF4054 domain-containing protein [Pseudomonas brenneri]WJM94070.1 DUF4054 domain-containing protein [Pseudomonas brenneri]
MVTYEMFVARFPEFTSTSQARFSIFLGDSQIEMGTEEHRWSNVYDVAQANLIAHFLVVAQGSATGDTMALMPIRSTDVDDVLVEYAVATVAPGTAVDNFAASIYGQQYVHWRNQAFAGARTICP